MKKRNSILAMLLVAALTISTGMPAVCAAELTSETEQSVTQEQSEMEQQAAEEQLTEVSEELTEDPEEITPEEEDPGNGRLEGNIPEEFYDGAGALSPQTVYTYTHDSRFNGYTIQKGIDVSYHNGTIDWAKVKAAGVQFAIIRVGYRGVATGTLCSDVKYQENIKNALAQGIQVGVYIYSQAITTKEAQEECAYMVNLIKGYSINLPIVFDYEYYSGGRLSKANLTDRQRTNICLAFCTKAKELGYTPMVYANKSMLSSDLYASEISAVCPIWLAQYNTKATYTGTYEYWQYSSSGSVNGISGRVDMNYHYIAPGSANVPMLVGSASSFDKVKLSWNKVSGASGYQLQRYNATKKKYVTIKSISKASTLTYTDGEKIANKQYKYRIRSYKKSNGKKTYSSWSSVVTVTTNAGKAAKINASQVNIRKKASASSSKVTQLSRNAAVTLVSSSGSWYKLSFQKNGKTKTGYVKKTYVTALAKPSLTVGADSEGKLTLTWNKVSRAQGYEVWRIDPTTGKYKLLKTLTSGAKVSLSNSGLTSGKEYTYRVRAYRKYSGKKVYSVYSAPVSAVVK